MNSNGRGVSGFSFWAQSTVLILSVALPAAARAQSTVYWNGTSTWADPAAWSGDAAGTTPGAVPTAADTAFFSATPVTTAPTVGLLADRSLAGLSFGGTATGTTSLTGGGSNVVLTLGPGGITLASTIGSAVTIGSATPNQDVSLAVGADQTWTNDSATRLLSILGGVSRAAGDTTSRTLTVGGAGSTLISGGIVDGGSSGSLGLTKTGAGTLTLGATNTFTGPLTLNGGYVAAASNAALGGGASQIVFGNGGGFQATGSFSLNRTVQMVAGTANVAVTPGNTLTLAGQLTNAGATTQINKRGYGTLDLTQAGPAAWSGSLNSSTAPTTLTGGLLVTAGSVRISNSSALGAASNIVAVGSAQGAGIDLPGGITLPNTVVLNLSAESFGDGYFNGNGLGQLTSTSGTNTVTGLVNIGRSNGSLGVAAGATLNVTGGVQGNGQRLGMVGPGAINISGGAITDVFGVQRINSGTTTITVPITFRSGSHNGLRAQGGGATLALAGPAFVNAHTRENSMRGGGTLRLDNSGEAVSTRTGGTSALRLVDATLNLVANGSSPVVERMAALQAAGGYSSIVVNTTGQNAAVQFDSLSQATANTLFFRSAGSGANFGSPSNQVVFRTTPPTLSPTPLGQGILARAIVEDGNGVNFATYSNGSIRAFTGYDTVNLNAVSLPTTSATSTVQVGSSVTLSGNRTVNAVKLTGGGLTLGSTGSTLTLTSGGLLATGGTSSIAAGLAVTSGATALGLTVADGSRVNVAAPLYSTAPITIGGGGTVEISAPIYTGDQYSINGGVTRLVAGGGLYPGQGTPTGSVQNLTVSYGAVLDLNGNSTLVGRFWGPDSPDYQNAAGEVTSTTPAMFAIRLQSQSFTPNRLTGALSVLNAGAERQWYTSDSTYTGRTAIMGGWVTLKDGARLSGTSALDLNYGSLLRFWNGDGQFALSDRVNDAAPVTFRGGYLEHVGRQNTDVTETLGATTLAEGMSDIYIDRGTTTLPGSAVLTLASLATTGGGVNFRARSTTAGPLGLPGDNPRVIITANETAPGAGLTNNLLGAWAVVEGTDFASYVPGRGVGALNQVGFPGYDGTTLPATSGPTQNIKLAADGTVPAGGLDLNSLVFSNNVSFTNASDTLNLTSGGLLRSSTATNYTVGAAANSGRLTAGGAGATGTQKLVISHNGTGTATTTINAQVVDNGSAPVQLVANLVNTGTLTLAGANTYTGGTVVSGRNSQGTVTVASGGVIPAGGLTINGGTVSQSTGGVINSANAVTINGAGTLTLTGSNTLASLAFNNTGTQNRTNNNPTVNAGTLTLSSATPITAGGMNPAGLATINGTLDFGNAAKTITVSPLEFDGMAFAPFSPSLNIAGVVTNSGKITVNGGGLLQVSGASTFSGGYSVASGSGLYINANSTGAVTNGPLGTGPLELASGARLLSGGTFSVANPVTLAGGLAFEGITSLTMSGGVALPAAGAATIDIPAPQPTLTLSGVLAGTGSALVKNGYGTLLLSGANTFDGGVTVNRGTVTVGNAAALGTGTLAMNGGGLNASTTSLTLANAQSWAGGFTFGGSNSLTLSGGVNLAQNSTVGVSAGTLTVSGAIGDSGANRGLTKSGAGTLALTGTNTYGGVTTVNAGVLAIAGTDSLPGWNTAGRVAVTDGGTIAVPNTVGDADVATMLGTGNFTAGGAIGFDTSAGDRALAATLPVGAGLSKLGANILTVSAASTHTGPTTVLAGTLRLADQLAAQNSILAVQSGATVQWDAGVTANAFTVGGLSGAGIATLTNTGSAGVALTIGGSNATTAFSGTLGGAGSLVKQGTGTQTLSGTGITYTGSTTVNAGTLVLDGANTYAASSTAVASGATLVVANSASQTIANPITGAGSLVKRAATTLTLSGANTFTGGTTIEQGTVVLSGTLSATSPITILATGTLQMGASNRWGDATTTTSAPITIGPAGKVQSGGFFNTLVDLQLAGGTLEMTGGLAGTGAYGLKGTVTVSQPSAINAASGSNNSISIGPSDQDGTLTFDVARMTSGTNVDLDVFASFQNPTGRTNSLTKNGPGTLSFRGVGTYTGGTIINGGTFRLVGSQQNALPVASPITVNSGATLEMGANDRWGNANTPATAPITVNAGGLVLSNNFFNPFINLTLNGGTLQSTGGFSDVWQAYGLKGTVTVGGSSASTINAGTGGNGFNGINIGPTPQDGAAGFLPVNVADATSSAAADLVVSVPLRNAFSDTFVLNANGITKTGAGTMQLSAVNTFTGGLNVNQGVLEVGGAGQLNAGNYAAAIAAAGTFRVASSANQTLAGVISGAGRFEKAGTGTLTLTGSNTFSGTAAVEAGTLVVNSTLPSGLSVAAAGWLAGTGSVGGTTTVAGTLSPGNSPGVMTFDTLSLGSTSTTLVELPAAGTRGTDYDGITVTAADGMTYGGGLALSFGGTILPDDTTFDVFSLTGTPSGSFANVTSTGFYTGTWTGAGGAFSLIQGEQQLTFTPSTGDVSIAYVPEPGTLLGAAVCLSALLVVRRRGRRR
jgi:autotransporter-associated beta strand protein